MKYVLVGTNDKLIWGDEIWFEADTPDQAIDIVGNNPEWLARYETRKLYQNPKGNDFSWAGTFCRGYDEQLTRTEQESEE